MANNAGQDILIFLSNRLFKHWYPDFSIAQRTHPFCNNANAAIRRNLWELHPYDETLPGLEDLEWGKWAQGRGTKLPMWLKLKSSMFIANHNMAYFNRYRREGMAFKQHLSA